MPTELGNVRLMQTFFKWNSNSLSREVPTQLGELTRMMSALDFSDNPQQRGTFPTQLGRMSAMESMLELGSADHAGSLTAIIPTELGNLVKMTSYVTLVGS
mmetsp:Transcript_75195/g.213865  ORF Transcript_75195/g.213865 Transcript_75195/m.213865 type:complete len:101 (+) Transcript_75195:157-459(+)